MPWPQASTLCYLSGGNHYFPIWTPNLVWLTRSLHTWTRIHSYARDCVTTDTHPYCPCQSPKEIWQTCRGGTDQDLLRTLPVGCGSSELWGQENYSILVRRFVAGLGFFLTHGHSLINFQRLQADVIDQFVPLQQYLKKLACLVFHQKRWWTSNFFSGTLFCFCNIHGPGWAFTNPLQAVSPKLSYSLG